MAPFCLGKAAQNRRSTSNVRAQPCILQGFGYLVSSIAMSGDEQSRIGPLLHFGWCWQENLEAESVLGVCINQGAFPVVMKRTRAIGLLGGAGRSESGARFRSGNSSTTSTRLSSY